MSNYEPLPSYFSQKCVECGTMVNLKEQYPVCKKEPDTAPYDGACVKCGTSARFGQRCSVCYTEGEVGTILIPPQSQALCKGSVYLGTGCMECERCREHTPDAIRRLHRDNQELRTDLDNSRRRCERYASAVLVITEAKFCVGDRVKYRDRSCVVFAVFEGTDGKPTYVVSDAVLMVIADEINLVLNQ